MAMQNLCEKLTHSADYCVLQDRLAMSPGHLLSWKKRRKNKYLPKVYAQLDFHFPWKEI